MKKRIIGCFSIALLLILIVVLGLILRRENQKDDPYYKAAEILLNSYGFCIDVDAEVIGYESDIGGARFLWEKIRNSDMQRYNLEGVTFDVSTVFNGEHINSEYENSVVRIYYFPLINSQGVETQAQFVFVDDTLAAAYIFMANTLAGSYLHDAGITDPPRGSWPLDVSPTVLNEDLAAWARILR